MASEEHMQQTTSGSCEIPVVPLPPDVLAMMLRFCSVTDERDVDLANQWEQYKYEKLTKTPGLLGPKQKKYHPVWLKSFGNPCHSESQLRNGGDLSNTKKKYKSMKCELCEHFVPYTQWAKLRSRKFEFDSLWDHERSQHHGNAIKLLIESSGRDPNTIMGFEPVVTQIPAAKKRKLAAVPTNNGKKGSAKNGDDTSDSEAGIAAIGAALNMKPKMTTVVNGYVEIDKSEYQNLDVSQATAVGPELAFKGSYAPDWCRVVGRLTYSSTQLAAGKVQEGAKKKYRNLYCDLCARYNPGSPWSTFRPRKFESHVMLDHERSFFHKKAVSSYELETGQKLVVRNMARNPIVDDNSPSARAPASTTAAKAMKSELNHHLLAEDMLGGMSHAEDSDSEA